MKYTIWLKGILLFLCCCFYEYLSAQSTVILPGGAKLNNNSTLNTFQFPKLTYDQIKSIPLPQVGDAVFDTNSGCVRVYNGREWICLTDNKSIPFSPVGFISKSFNAAAFGYAIGKNYTINCNDLAGDPQNNLYMAGLISNISLNGLGCSSTWDYSLNGTPTGYLAKYNSSNQPQWCFNLPGKIIGFPPPYPYTYSNFSSEITSVKATNDGVYFLARFSQTITVNGVDLSSAGGVDILLGKLNPANGSLLWLKKITNGSGDEIPGTLLLDANQNIYITGRFNSNFTLDGITTINCAGGTDAFVAKFNSNGVLQYSNAIGGPNNDQIADIEFSGGSISAVGTFVSSATIGGTALSGLSGDNLFHITLNDQLALQSSSSFNTTGSFSIGDIVQTASGLMVAGRLSGSAQLGPVTYENTGFIVNMTPSYPNTYELLKISRGNVGKLAYSNGDMFGILNFTGNTSIDNVPIAGTARGSEVALFKITAKSFSPTLFKWAKVLGDKDSDYSIYQYYNAYSHALLIKSSKEVLFTQEEFLFLAQKVVNLDVMKYVE